jgi:hypothetical protein
MADTRPKHKPNEKHTLDEVLKSLQDLVRGEVLVKPAPPPAAAPTNPPAVDVASATPLADMRDIIDSLEDLLESDLNLEEKVELAKAALAPVRHSTPRAPKPHATPVTAAPVVERTAPRETPTPAPPVAKVEPTPPAPPPPPAPLLDSDDELVFESETPVAETPALEFPEEMTDDDIAKALAEIELEMKAAEPPTIEAAPAPEPFLEPEPIVLEAAPPPEAPAAPVEDLTLDESFDLVAAEPTRKAPPALSLVEPSIEVSAEAPPHQEIEIVEDIVAPAPPELTLAEDVENIDLSSGDTLSRAAPTEIEASPAPVADDFSIDFTPKTPPAAAAPEPEDLAPPPWEEEEMQRAEPPGAAGDSSLTSLGESIELDLSVSDNVSAAPDSVTIALDEVVELAPAPATEVIAPPVAPAPTAPKPEPKKPAAKSKEIPVLKDVAVAPAAATAPIAPAVPAAPAPKPAAADDFTLDFAPTTPPAKPAAPQDLHQMAVRVIAKLNIELRKGGKPPLDAKTINRLQQLLKEALEKKQ